MKWVLTYVLELLGCLYKVHLDKSPDKVLYLRNNLLNRHIYEWWHQKTGDKIPVRWLHYSELNAGLEAVTSTLALFMYMLLSRRLCLPVRPRKFKIMVEAVNGLRNPVLRDDFFVDDERILRKDVLFYTFGSSAEPRLSAYEEVRDSEYGCINVNKLRIPINILFPRLFKYHLLLPLSFIFNNFGDRQNYLLKEWFKWFHGVAIGDEILLSHYQIGLGLSVNEGGLSHIPETIILNNYGVKNVIFHWSDLTGCGTAHHHFKSFNLYLIWGKAHPRGKQSFVDNIIETGCWLKHNFGEFAKNKRGICERLGLPSNGHKILVFYDESFNPNGRFTEETLLDFWQMMLELIEKNTGVIGILKPKFGDKIRYSLLSDQGRQIFDNIRQKCSESGRFYFIDNPQEVGVTEVIAISDINISMGMTSPSTIALLCGKIGLYYDTTDDDYHPFAQKYRNKVIFDNKKGLFHAVNNIINQGGNPLDEIDEDLLRDYDHFRDDRGLERFRAALLANL
ncbi:hypothetical protein ES707_16798 [subsurface metagenome]